MARYINEDEFVAWVKEHWCADCQNDNGLRCRACWIDDAIDIVEEAPEADVVPKSEVDNWYQLYHSIKEELKQEKMYHRETENLCDRYCIESQHAKEQIAREIREIFEEIEKIFGDAINGSAFYGMQYAELKKKHIKN